MINKNNENADLKGALSFILVGLSVFLVAYILGINLIIPALLISLSAYLPFRYPGIKNYRLINIVFLYVIILVISYYIIKKGWPASYIPFCAIAMLSSILFNQLEISLLLVLASSVSIASVAGNNLHLGLLFLISGVWSSMLIIGVRRRMTVIRVGIIVGIIQALALLFLENFQIRILDRYLLLILNGAISSIIVLGVLPIFEYLFKTITDISLLELADFNHPLLQRLILEAPGTYHHSLIVGNISEAACKAVGANALLARIGAYYHDIGKLHKPDYFSENQEREGSKHDLLSPTMSKIVIMNHVKEGVELAHKYKFNPTLIDFIQQHHGKGLVYYFYRRALESIEEDQEVKEEGFRYPGPKPNTKETAIVLLADSVEAATRALREPTPKNIEEIVRKVVNNKFIDGQLDECDLTLKDLEKISAVFIHILGGIYHSRTVYPEQDSRSENNHKESSKENSRLSEKDKTGSS